MKLVVGPTEFRQLNRLVKWVVTISINMKFELPSCTMPPVLNKPRLNYTNFWMSFRLVCGASLSDGIDQDNDNCTIRGMLSERVKHMEFGGYVASVATAIW